MGEEKEDRKIGNKNKEGRRAEEETKLVEGAYNKKKKKIEEMEIKGEEELQTSGDCAVV